MDEITPEQISTTGCEHFARGGRKMAGNLFIPYKTGPTFSANYGTNSFSIGRQRVGAFKNARVEKMPVNMCIQ